jgi:formylglycine-generating enzyme required for sulfatase activity
MLSPTGTNNANCDTGTNTDPTNLLTPVGAFSASPGPYGTFDMGGDVWEWNEAVVLYDGDRGSEGGSWYSSSACLASWWYNQDPPTEEYSTLGFRVASVAEPSTITLLLTSAACLLGCAWRRRTA